VNSADFTQLSQFVHYAQQRFDLPWLAGAFTDSRPQPDIPSRAAWLSLILGEGVQVGSHLQIEAETQLPQWQRWVGHPGRISHDTFGYVSERLDPAQLRRAGVWINRKLKRGKAFEASKLKGLLVVSLDAHEQFCSECRCCPDCLSREVTCKSADGREFKKTQYYHKQVYAQLSGPGLSVILDFEPMRPGEEECAAALRLLRRLRREYGPRFFDGVVVDSWYANGPFLKAVVEELGWPVMAVLKQERFEVPQEALALTAGRQPAHQVERDGRHRWRLGRSTPCASATVPLAPCAWGECANGGGSVIALAGPGCRRTRSRTGSGSWRVIWTGMTAWPSGMGGICAGRWRITPLAN
jgi:hypothetical protein